jgi:hypothetical protein
MRRAYPYAVCGGLAVAIHARSSGQDLDDIRALEAGDDEA